MSCADCVRQSRFSIVGRRWMTTFRKLPTIRPSTASQGQISGSDTADSMDSVKYHDDVLTIEHRRARNDETPHCARADLRPRRARLQSAGRRPLRLCVRLTRRRFRVNAG